MFDAQTLFAGDTVYSPWFPREGDNLRATADVIAKTATNLVVQVFTKNSEDTDDGQDVDPDTKITITSETVGDNEWGENSTTGGAGGLQELVRFKFTVTGSDQEYVLFRMLQPVWFDAVKV